MKDNEGFTRVHCPRNPRQRKSPHPNYLQRVDDVVNSIREYGVAMKEEDIVLKVLRFMIAKIEFKISTIEQGREIKLTLDEVHAIITAYEMRIAGVEPSKREVAFKAFKKGMDGAQKKDKVVVIVLDNEENDEEEEKFMRRLRRGYGKYKGKLPFKCINCGRIGHFASKFPYGTKDGTKKKENISKNKKNYPKRKNFGKKKKILYINEESEVFDSSDSLVEEQGHALVMKEVERQFIFMAKEAKDQKDAQTEDSHEGEEEAIVDLEGDLISALEYLDELRDKYDDLKKENKKLKNNLQKETRKLTQELEDSNKMIVDLKVHVEELKIIEDFVKSNLQSEMEKGMNLESEIVTLRKYWRRQMSKSIKVYN